LELTKLNLTETGDLYFSACFAMSLERESKAVMWFLGDIMMTSLVWEQVRV